MLHYLCIGSFLAAAAGTQVAPNVAGGVRSMRIGVSPNAASVPFVRRSPPKKQQTSHASKKQPAPPALARTQQVPPAPPRKQPAPPAPARAQQTSPAADACAGKLAFYHRDAMSPYGFGCQYNHWITFLSIALLEERTPVEAGRWTLSCPKAGKSGFWDCFSSVPRTSPSCEPAHNVYIGRFEKGWGKFLTGNYARHMCGLDLLDLDEWHLDGDMVRGHRKEFNIDCSGDSARELGPSSAMDVAIDVSANSLSAPEFGETQAVSADLSDADVERSNRICHGSTRWTPRANSSFARKICADTGLKNLELLHIYRYVAQRVVPIDGFEEAKQKCRALWPNKQKALAIHVRRTDKTIHEDKAHSVGEYLDTAIRIQGWKFDVVHIVTDDPKGVGHEIVCKEFSLAEGGGKHKFDCTTFKRSKDQLKRLEGAIGDASAGFHGLLEDVACLAEADYLVGSHKSNIPWLAQTLRSRAPNTAIGLGGVDLKMP